MNIIAIHQRVKIFATILFFPQISNKQIKLRYLGQTMVLKKNLPLFMEDLTS